jgi:hypothetical protein
MLQDSVKFSKPNKELDGVEAHDENLLTQLRNPIVYSGGTTVSMRKGNVYNERRMNEKGHVLYSPGQKVALNMK